MAVERCSKEHPLGIPFLLVADCLRYRARARFLQYHLYKRSVVRRSSGRGAKQLWRLVLLAAPCQLLPWRRPGVEAEAVAEAVAGPQRHRLGRQVAVMAVLAVLPALLPRLQTHLSCWR